MHKTTICLLILTVCSNFLLQTTFAEIRISEILPNPEGTDKGNEWIELVNLGNKSINLSGWQILSGKKKQKLTDTINPHDYLILENLKIYLPNKNANIKLLDTSENLVDEISYEKAESGKSFAHTSIKNNNLTKTKWLWDTPSKNQKNPALYYIKEKIKTEPIIEENKIIINNLEIPLTNSNSNRLLFKPGNTITVLAKKQNNSMTAIKYQIETNPTYKPEQPEKNSFNYIFLLLGFFVLLSAYWYWRK